MSSGHIVERNGSFRVMVYAGRDPVTGSKRQITRTVRGSRKDAERVRNQLLVQVQNGTASPSSATFGELLDAWYDAVSPDWSPRTAVEHRRIIDSVLDPALGKKKLANLRASDLDALYGSLRAGAGDRKPLSPATVRKFHTVARAALQQAVRWEWIGSNPAANASPPKGRRKEPKPPTPEDLARLLKAAEEQDPDFYVFVRLAAVLGARRGEVLGIRWADLTSDHHSVEINSSVVIGDGQVVRKETKTDRVRRVAIDDATAALLDQHRERWEDRAREGGTELVDDAYVLSYEIDGSLPWRPDSATRRFTKLRDKLGLDDVRLHDLRHYVATRLIANGVDPRTVANRLGHASPSTTLSIYSHFVPEADRDAADLLGGLIDGE
ncbi:MAG TPA: tyrosine-type recombinase/integrase [Microthrixaceae bacterium]|nr:site-specific integrase [Microthrixaceae bacterium]MCB9375336.1 site-specific integrase [Microthrixaceae bacterium]MCB9401305.1 site-specific integrase [Microthrixaceae bacterium]HMV74792.1 tyrosine-type recombinase/integrase [Microthrixaceae bacterium]HMX09205.1 tyrosine-type recombinase/integrase [Microthrixaceae bacterium]